MKRKEEEVKRKKVGRNKEEEGGICGERDDGDWRCAQSSFVNHDPPHLAWLGFSFGNRESYIADIPGDREASARAPVAINKFRYHGPPFLNCFF